MTKKDLIGRMDELLQENGMHKIGHPLSGAFGWKDNKETLADAVKCLEATDEEMNDYLTVIKLKYPNIYNVVVNNGDWLTHNYNRYYVYSTAKATLA